MELAPNPRYSGGSKSWLPAAKIAA